MRTRQRNEKGKRSGISLVEVLIASSILTVVLMGALTMTLRESRFLSDQATINFGEAHLQALVRRMENDLRYAQGWAPTAWLTQSLGSGADATVSVDTTLGFPDQGMLLIDRGSVNEERVWYTQAAETAGTFSGLWRGQQCSMDRGHGEGTSLSWAALATPIDDQVAPPADQWDGSCLEFTGATFFQGDGTGISFRSPMDPTGAAQFLDANGDIQWGATVAGAPNLNGHSAYYFEPSGTLSEADRGADLNQDGDQDDIYDLGRIRLRSWDSQDPDAASTDTALCPPIVLQEQCNWGGDLDNDGFDDPIFLWMPRTGSLHTRMLVLVGSMGGRPITRRIEAVTYLKNGSN